MGLIWLICAMKGEWSNLKKVLPNKSVKLFQVGIGTHRASEAFRSILDAEPDRPDLVIHFGISGGLIPGLREGELILCDSVTNLSGDRIDLSHGLRVAAETVKKMGKVRIGGLLSSEKILHTPAEKKEAGLKTGAIVVDLETFPIAQQAQTSGLPILALRSVSDPMESDLSELANVDFVNSQGNTDWQKIPGGLLKNPRLLFHLPKYQSAYHKATKALSEAITALIGH